ncbi:hypothetical protein KEM56_001173 [Ascosphaera pollenicola]|nr:hypothetical protein KEM56_001173 [Ascosphaera pollenicola]
MRSCDMSPLAVRASASAPYGQVSGSGSGSGAQNMCVHEKDVVDAAVASNISTDAGAGAGTGTGASFRADEHHHTSFANDDYLIDRRRYRYDVTSFSCPSSPSPLVLQHSHAARVAGGNHISGSTPTHAFTDSETSFVGDNKSMGLAYNTTPPAPMSAYRSPTPSGTGELGIGHRRKGSALRSVMKRLFNRKKSGGGDGSREVEDEETKYDGDYGHLGDISFTRTRCASPYSPPTRAGIRSEPSRHAAVTSDSSPRAAKHQERIVGVAVGHDEEEDCRKKGRYARRPRAGRRRTASSAPVSEGEGNSSSTSILDTEYMGDSSSRHSPAHSSGVFRGEERKPSPDLYPRSVSAAAIREAARHVRRASEDVQIARIDASEVSPFPLLPQQNATADGAPANEEQPAGNFDRDESNRVSSLQSFNFGTFNREDAGGLGQRVATIEVKLMDLELAISRLQGNASTTNPSAPTRHPPAPPVQASRSVESPRVSDNFLAVHLPDPLFVPPTPSSPSSPRSYPVESPTSPTPLDRFLNDTANPISSSPDFLTSGFDAPSPSAREGKILGMTAEQYTGLVDLIRREQESRRVLEEQVAALQRQLASLESSRR